MGARHPHRRCRCSSRLHLLSSPLFFLSFILPASSFAQLTSSTTPSATSNPPASSTSIAIASSVIPTTFSTLTSPPSSITSSIPLSQHNPTSSPTGPITRDNAPQLYPASTATSLPSDAAEDRKSHLLNYYFLFLALIGVLLCFGVYLLHRRKRRIKARLRNSGQNALARDLDGWINTRRWGNSGGPGRQEEGLNEQGEAPPPYQPKDDEIAGGGSDNPHAGVHQDAASGLTIPLRTLPRNERAILKPPDYQESVHSVSVAGSTRPNTNSLRPTSSTGDLLRPLNSIT